MAEITKPDLSNVWASAGDVLKPSDSKIIQGWSAEIPPRQWFNWWQNRADNFIAYLNQHGIPVWDSKTEYQANKSYVQGSDGVLYQATATNTNVNPVGDSTSWKKAFASTSDIPVVATAAQSRAFTNNSVFLSPLQLANAFSGSQIQLSANGFLIIPGANGQQLLINWGNVLAASQTTTPVSFSKQFTTPFLVQVTPNDVDTTLNYRVSATNLTATGFNAITTKGQATSISWIAFGLL